MPGLTILTSLLAAALLLTLILWVDRRRHEERMRLVTEIIDLADATENGLRECRRRLREIGPIVAAWDRVNAPSAHSTPSEPVVQAALRDLLAHRLWLKANAQTASFGALRSARDALLNARTTLAAQLEQLLSAREQFDQARREDNSLQRTYPLAASPH
ncbi:MAG: hypothetical protein WBV61_01325 [Rhodanobacteraceae bacterium]